MGVEKVKCTYVNDKPMIFKGEPWCSDACRKYQLGQITFEEFQKLMEIYISPFTVKPDELEQLMGS
jgi:hypothetical protein